MQLTTQWLAVNRDAPQRAACGRIRRQVQRLIFEATCQATPSLHHNNLANLDADSGIRWLRQHRVNLASCATQTLGNLL